MVSAWAGYRRARCESSKDRNVVPATEEGSKCGGLADVAGKVSRLSLNASHRSQLCAGESGVIALVIRRWYSVKGKNLAGEPNAVPTHWLIAPHPTPESGFSGLPRQHWQADLLRVRDGEPHSWIVKACDATGHLAFPLPTGKGDEAF